MKKERSAASDGRDVQPMQGGLSMSLHVSPRSLQVVWLVSEPGSFRNMNLVLHAGSNIQVRYYSSTAAEEVEPQEVDETFVTIGWSLLSWEPNS